MNKDNYLRWGRWVMLTVLLISPVPSLAAKWVLIDVGDSYEIEIEAEGVRPNKSAWFRYTLTPPSNKFCSFQPKKVAYMKQFVEGNCKGFSIRTKQQVSYDEGHTVIGLCGEDTPDARFQEYIPETVGETLFKAICDPAEREENRFLNFIREKKREQMQKLEKQALEGKQRNEESERKALLEKYRRDANTPEALEAVRKRAAELDARERSKKQAGEACTSSSECAGILLCAPVGVSQMQCVSSDVVIHGIK